MVFCHTMWSIHCIARYRSQTLPTEFASGTVSWAMQKNLRKLPARPASRNGRDINRLHINTSLQTTCFWTTAFYHVCKRFEVQSSMSVSCCCITPRHVWSWAWPGKSRNVSSKPYVLTVAYSLRKAIPPTTIPLSGIVILQSSWASLAQTRQYQDKTRFAVSTPI